MHPCRKLIRFWKKLLISLLKRVIRLLRSINLKFNLSLNNLRMLSKKRD